ncbi:alpha/beta hydrolase [Neorhizobium galegae]|uniref:alpha/beta hydrolase n=1 Tax=Neorhizobium galegae TaxID=399 RepID=UPI000622AF11|nr:alpha/beta fold hydrolase [Neorhizobium galegae]KAB1126038.1 alpha/beta hydrolase [Neorhizobium galegae]MCQ1804997.1 lysophospholipase [Neorhizobium galegae]CDZ55742.1 Alpha/beta hydrolase family protein [Neorhizobium galegae bv. orientalis]
MRRSFLSWRTVIYVCAILVAAFGVMLMSGPRMPADGFPAFDKARLGTDIDAYLAAGESRYPDIRPGAAKRIVWADPATKAKTAFAIVYLHGFSASAEEIRPLPDRVAAALGANLYFTRLAGHGRSGDAMGEPSLEDWLADFSESLAIGEALGNRVIVIGTSTGASLATLALADPKIASRISAAVFVSPNYGINSFGAFLLTTPVAQQLSRLLLGESRSFTPYNDCHAAHWTTRYPTSALLPMAALVKLSVASPVEQIKTPALFLYSSLDQVIRPDKVREVAGRWGGPHALFDVGKTGDPGNHVIAGDITSSTTTGPLADRTIAWLNGILK